jgi:ketosteroid isomerase-like protein
MLTLRRTMLVFLASLLIPAAAQAASLREQVRATYAAFDAAFNTGRAEAVARFYTDNALLLPGSPDGVKGRAAITRFFTDLLATGLFGHRLELIEANGDDRVVVAAARFSIQARNGPDLSGVVVHEFVRGAGGNLKIRLQIFYQT